MIHVIRLVVVMTRIHARGIFEPASSSDISTSCYCFPAGTQDGYGGDLGGCFDESGTPVDYSDNCTMEVP
jgi:hypothetical protein